MNKELESKIINLIEDYMKNGLRITIHPATPDGQFWISLADSDDAPYIKAINNIACSINSLSTNIDGVNAIVDPEVGQITYKHPLSAIAEALHRIAHTMYDCSKPEEDKDNGDL